MSTKSYPTLYGKSRKGKIKEWSISVVEQGDLSIINTLHGFADGKKQLDYIEVTVGKNIGKANETTPFEQAVSVAKSKWNSKIDGGYSEDIHNIPEDMLPMLAKDFHDYSHKITFPCYVQPKFDGVRCLAKKVDGIIEFTSRKGKRFRTIEHVAKQLLKIMNVGDVFDGEIYLHGEDFQDVLSAVRNEKSKEKAQLDCNLLEYHMYDIADKHTDFENRLAKMNRLIPDDKIIICPTYNCNCETDVKVWHDKFVAMGYEGCILRNKKGGYDFDFRSDNLQKYKEFQDEEFEIVDMKSGQGRYKDCGCFICITKDGKRFDCNPKGTIERKQQYLRDKDKHIGQWLIVQFQEKSKDGIPRFPVGKAIRLEIDMPIDK